MAVDFRTIFSIFFFSLLGLFVYLNRSKMQTTKILGPLLYFSMYRTTLGISLMDTWAKKWRRALHYLGVFGIGVGFLGMIAISVLLVKNLIDSFTKPDAAAGVGLVLPIKAKGIFYVPIEYWIICIFVIALVHEFAHGVIARAYGIKVKSSGFAFLGAIIPIIPAAFVEPDEKQMAKKKLSQRLAVFSAGPFSNVIVALLCLLILMGLAPFSSQMLEEDGVLIDRLVDGEYPAKAAGMAAGEIITSVNGKPIELVSALRAELDSKKPGESVLLGTDKKTYTIVLGSNPEDPTKGYLGAYLDQSTSVKPSVIEKYGKILPAVFLWIVGLFLFMHMLNLGIGLFNLLPIGPLDGGHMLRATLTTYLEKEKAMKLFSMIGLLFLAIVLMNLFSPLLSKLV